jgi:D-alanyl-D-alanine carboxypeptidase (penicillin-binding protein 5/6)
MSKKSIMGLIAVAVITLAGMIIGVNFMISQGAKLDDGQKQPGTIENDVTENNEKNSDSGEIIVTDPPVNIAEQEPWLTNNPSDSGNTAGLNDKAEEALTGDAGEPTLADDTEATDEDSQDSQLTLSAGDMDRFGEAVSDSPGLPLIYESSEVDYMAYIPAMKTDSVIEAALDINNPEIELDAKAAILFDVATKEVLYYKAAVEPVFPASTVKLLNALVALEQCKEEEEVTVGEEISLVASDSTKAYLKEGQVLTIRNLLEGMLLPSGNDAAYVIAAYVGNKSLQKKSATKEEAIVEFVRLMNRKAQELGVKNSCFKTPDGYDAIGQYTTAYDMGMIGLEAIKNNTVREIVKKSSARNIFVSGEDVTWESTNALIKKNSGRYYSYAIGLKTGTSTMAGRCLISAACKEDREILCVIMNSSSSGRWDDSTALLKYGLEQ